MCLPISLKVVLDCGDETIKGVFCTVPPSIIAWQLSKLVHYCMTVTFGDVENIVDFKTEITTTIKLLTDCIMKNKSILKGE